MGHAPHAICDFTRACVKNISLARFRLRVRKLFLYVHGFANRLKRTIVTVDARTHQLLLSKYAPGYAPQLQLSMREAVALRTSSEQPVWVLLEPNHFSALLPSAWGMAISRWPWKLV